MIISTRTNRSNWVWVLAECSVYARDTSQTERNWCSVRPFIVVHSMCADAERARKREYLRMLIYSRRTNRVNKSKQSQHPISNMMMHVLDEVENVLVVCVFVYLFSYTCVCVCACVFLRFENLQLQTNRHHQHHHQDVAHDTLHRIDYFHLISVCLNRFDSFFFILKTEN